MSTGSHSVARPATPALSTGEANAAEAANADTAPASLRVAPGIFECAGETAAVKIEVAVTAGEHIAVSGWSVGPLTIDVFDRAGRPVGLQRFARADVARHFDQPVDDLHGWACVLPLDDRAAVDVAVSHAGVERVREHVPLDQASTLPADQVPLLGPVSGIVAFAHAPFSREWARAVAQARPAAVAPVHVHGFLESALAIQSTGRIVVVGWVLAGAGATVWLEDATGAVHPIERMATLKRDDLHALLAGEFGADALHGGFVALVEGVERGTLLRLKALTANGTHLLSEIVATEVPPSPVRVARWLSGIPFVDGSIERTYALVGGPLLEPLIEADRATWPALPTVERSLGAQVQDPAVAIIVPLYGRFDFVEDQMVEWARDPWVRERAEIVYVVDDPAMVRPFGDHADELYRLYGVPFRWIWGHANRGFSGANNLGAAHTRAPKLLFLNSDAFPQRPGWLADMVHELDARPDVGVIGPRLTFAEGGIQHAGMAFERSAEHDVWINRHPGIGLDPAFDPHPAPTRVPAVTGACLLVRAADFAAVSGWDTGYLVGDFEDSDLCLKLGARGLSTLYMPNVQLTHLERQSMNRLGEDAVRTWITLWNAVRHQRRWGDAIARHVEGRA